MATAGGDQRVNPLAESILSAQELARSKEALDAQTFGLKREDNETSSRFTNRSTDYR